MALNDIWQLTLRYRYLNEEMLNVFYFQETVAETVNTPQEAVAEYFETLYIPDIIAPMHTTSVMDAIDVKQLTGGVAIHSATLSDIGSAGGESMPPYVTFAFRYNRASAASRHGYKRFGGVPETAQNAGILAGAYQTLMDALEATLITDLTDTVASGDGTFTPVIVSKYSGNQLRPTPVAFPVASVEFIGITTQNTRKF